MPIRLYAQAWWATDMPSQMPISRKTYKFEYLVRSICPKHLIKMSFPNSFAYIHGLLECGFDFSIWNFNLITYLGVIWGSNLMIHPIFFRKDHNIQLIKCDLSTLMMARGVPNHVKICFFKKKLNLLLSFLEVPHLLSITKNNRSPPISICFQRSANKRAHKINSPHIKV